MIGLIGAINQDGIYAHGGSGLPWHLGSDFQNFKKLTVGNGNNAVIMGVETRKETPNLKGRQQIIVSTTKRLMDFPNFLNNLIYRSLSDAIKHSEPRYNKLWLIGGGNIWRFGLRFADFVSVTVVEKKIIPDETTKSCPELLPWSNELKNFTFANPKSFPVSEKDEVPFKIYTGFRLI